MTLADIADLACAKVGKSDDAFIALAKRFCVQRWEMIWNAQLWNDSKVLTSVTTTANNAWLMAPDPIERIVAVRFGTNRTLAPIQSETVFDYQNDLWESSGDPIRFVNAAPVVSDAHTNQAGTIAGWAVTDYGKVCTVLLETSLGVQHTFRFTFDGSGSVIISPNSQFIVSINQEATDNLVSYAHGTTNTQLGSTSPNVATRNARIRLLGIPTTATAVLVLGKRRRPDLLNDGDAPLLLGVDNALIAFTTSDLWKRLRQYTKATAELQEATAHIASMVDQEKSQQACQVQIIPYEEPDPFGAGVQGFSGKGYW